MSIAHSWGLRKNVDMLTNLRMYSFLRPRVRVEEQIVPVAAVGPAMLVGEEMEPLVTPPRRQKFYRGSDSDSDEWQDRCRRRLR